MDRDFDLEFERRAVFEKRPVFVGIDFPRLVRDFSSEEARSALGADLKLCAQLIAFHGETYERLYRKSCALKLNRPCSYDCDFDAAYQAYLERSRIKVVLERLNEEIRRLRSAVSIAKDAIETIEDRERLVKERETRAGKRLRDSDLQ